MRLVKTPSAAIGRIVANTKQGIISVILRGLISLLLQVILALVEVSMRKNYDISRAMNFLKSTF
jgi:hypothetical protein